MFLPGASLAPALRADGDLAAAMRGAETVVSVAPSHAVRPVMAEAAKALDRSRPLIVSASKGLDPDRLERPSSVLAEVLPPGVPVAVLSGPSFAWEVFSQQPTAVVAAADDHGVAQRTQRVFSTSYFRVYSHTDVVGAELAGALKNVIALAAGILEGLGLGFNTRAALITRGLAEITRLGVTLGAQPMTFAGLAGMGDLILTATGALSRNRTLGVALGQGKTLEQALAGKPAVVEGVNTTRTAVALGERHGVELPIAREVANVLFKNKPPRQAVSDLMERELKAEGERGGGEGGPMSSGTPAQPVQEFFSIGEVCQLTDLKPHVLRYWESQFRFLNPAKNRSGNRVYQRREIELIMLVKHLLYTEKYTIEGARQKIEHYRRSGELKPEARRALATQTVKDLRSELKSVLGILEGHSPNATASGG